MFSRFLATRSSPLRLSATLTARVCSRSLSTFHVARPIIRYAAPWSTHLRRFSAAPASRDENRDATRTPRAPSGTCFVANIPYKITAKELQEAFSEFGKVESIRMLVSEGGMSRGVGFVQFESVADAVSFVEAHEADPIFILDRQLYIEHAQKTKGVSKPVEPSDTLMVPNFQGQSEVEARAMFGSFADNILAVRFHKRDADQSSRTAFIQFRTVDVATDAIDAFKNNNENIQISYARQRQPPAKSYTLTSRLSLHREQ